MFSFFCKTIYVDWVSYVILINDRILGIIVHFYLFSVLVFSQVVGDVGIMYVGNKHSHRTLRFLFSVCNL
jgi:hypothetical protein